MKKTVKSKAALDEIALNKGGTVTSKSGAQFNSSKKKTATRMPPKKKVAPKPEPIGPDEGSKMVAESIEKVGRANAMMMAELKREIEKIKFEAATPPTEWVFDFIRNKDGFITQITAKSPKPRLNS